MGLQEPSIAHALSLPAQTRCICISKQRRVINHLCPIHTKGAMEPITFTICQLADRTTMFVVHQTLVFVCAAPGPQDRKINICISECDRSLVTLWRGVRDNDCSTALNAGAIGSHISWLPIVMCLQLCPLERLGVRGCIRLGAAVDKGPDGAWFCWRKPSRFAGCNMCTQLFKSLFCNGFVGWLSLWFLCWHAWHLWLWCRSMNVRKRRETLTHANHSVHVVVCINLIIDRNIF